QPDFTWLKPYEEKVFKQYFMPYKAVGQVKNATINAALNVEKTEEGKLAVCVYATSRYDIAQIKIEYDGKEIFSDETALSPVDIYEKEPKLEVPDIYKVKVSVYAAGKELVSYQAKDQGIPELAEPAKAAKLPQDIITNEELYLTGQHIEQYRHATWLPDPYYLEGLKRDPDDTRINNAYGLLLLRRGRFELSEKYFRAALKRLTSMHPNPYDSEPYYNLGLSLFYQEKYDDAFDAFYKATWVNELQEMSFYYLAAIASRKGEYEEALELIEKSLVKNMHSIKARGLKALILWKLGREAQAKEWIGENLKLDAFDFASMFTLICISGDAPELIERFHDITRDFHETYLMASRDLAESGFYEEAVKLLSMYPGDKPMIHYYSGAYLKKLGHEEQALEEFVKGKKADSSYCFPNKLEDVAVLTSAVKSDDTDEMARYYLGCLYYDKLQFDLAIGLWEESRAISDSFPTLLRNLSIAYYNKKDEKEKARQCLERAFELDRTDARVFLELDQLYQKLQVSLEERLMKYQENIGLIEKRDDLYTEYVTLLNSLGMYDEAYEKISSHNFQTWEGAEGKITAQFKVSLVERAKALLTKGDGKAAKELLEEALSYPGNLGEGRLEGTKDNHIYYNLGRSFELLGDKEKAEECYEKATLGAMEVAGMMYYYDQPADMILYQGLAKEKLSDQMGANARFYRLLNYGEKHLRDTFKMDYFAVSMPDMSVFDADMTRKNEVHCYYLMGLANLGLGRRSEAVSFFKKVIEMDNTHQNAYIYLKMAEG
nr:tetratricopeptide repeat protein [Butyrivibrio sp.]